ncbi:MAG: tRNA 2-thiouridine(34) synthase MnmA [Actinobacteria bacterium]|nr:tRNA 2-thiouridine(34) synthase MnmA [Actinomycetota bacterium]MBT3746482.1 tRNA 2-thiouridine(34) synthase MnmA [Actinomycetota bacterium]MBT3968736.1 tRNA 2-thiouridine(34) synthase MnmA [Actinomycetota bacterium]MBT4009348.1 tRNA 2-thiouridine(34) synthase MnmA [Actinomycetota bacterium]MBT4303864.1 tRNA 2-thiouridine(34) synthase MnmA [Actinomycetota bacterium]
MSRVMVAMSGGVDSSVAAALMLEAGHEVVGVTLRLWGGESDSGCCAVSDVDDARRVADTLGIDHHVFNMSEEFDQHVVEPYVAAHAAGLTPNPCLECNRHIKFDLLHRRVEALGFERLATGHHARVVQTAAGVYRMARAVDAAKDQSYVLHMLGQEQLAALDLPVGEMTKDEVRQRAATLGLRTATKPDSQDVCFITQQHGRQDFLRQRISLTPGRVVDADGNELGKIESVEMVTIGQRKGVATVGGADPRYAIAVDVPSATVTVGSAADLLVKVTPVKNFTWAEEPFAGPVLAQISAHGQPMEAELAGNEVRWAQRQRRVAPGQAVVFYDGDQVIGGAIAG